MVRKRVRHASCEFTKRCFAPEYPARGPPGPHGSASRSHLNPVYLPLGKVLCVPGARLGAVYFPTTALVSLQYGLANGTCAELAVVGNEGIIGIAVFMGGETSPARAIVDRSGYAYRLKAPILKEEFIAAARSRICCCATRKHS